MRVPSLALGVLAAALLVSSPLAAQNKVGIINFQNAVLNTAELKKAFADLQNKYKPQQDALAKAQQELQDLEEQLRASQGRLSSSGAAELQARGQRKELQVQRMQEDLQANFEAERDAAIRLTTTRMTEVLKKLATDKALDLIVDSASVPYFAGSLDVTTDSTTAYDATYPAK